MRRGLARTDVLVHSFKQGGLKIVKFDLRVRALRVQGFGGNLGFEVSG